MTISDAIEEAPDAFIRGIVFAVRYPALTLKMIRKLDRSTYAHEVEKVKLLRKGING